MVILFVLGFGLLVGTPVFAHSEHFEQGIEAHRHHKEEHSHVPIQVYYNQSYFEAPWRQAETYYRIRKYDIVLAGVVIGLLIYRSRGKVA